MKKVFLSLATIAFVAAGSLTVTSCGGDDSSPVTPPPPPVNELTENFIQVNNDQEEIVYSLLAYHANGASGAPIKEYATTDGTKYIMFEMISHNGTAVGTLSSATAQTWVTIATIVDDSVPVDSTADSGKIGGGRYFAPFTEGANTQVISAYTDMNDTDYDFADTFEFDITALSFGQTGAATYVLTGADESDSFITLTTNLNGNMPSFYSLDASSAKGTKLSKKDAKFTLVK